MKVRYRSLSLLLAATLVFTLIVGAFSIVWLRDAHAAHESHARKIAISTPPTANQTPFNNEGISPDANPSAGNFDGGGRSYSNDALTTAGFAPGASISTGGYTFQWVTPAAGAPDNWLIGAQAIPLTTSAPTVAFLGAGTAGPGGPATGTGYIRYSDGSMQAYTLTFSDWTLDGGSVGVDPHDTITVETPYRNTPTGKDMTNTYIFMTVVTLLPGKTTTSVILPTAAAQGGLHVFALAAAPTAATFTAKGITNNTNPAAGNFDGAGNSYSNNALAAAGLGSGSLTPIYSFQAQWPSVAVGAKDAWNAPGTVIPVAAGANSGATLAIVGAASGGASSGTATITYSDATTQNFTLAFSDWTLMHGTQQQLATNYTVAQTSYYNTPTGQHSGNVYVFATFVGLAQGKAVKSLTLPATETGGNMAVFAVAVGAANIPFNLAAISANNAPTSANFDGGGRSYSNNALAFAGITSGSVLSSNGFNFQWATNAAGNADAWQSVGQTIPVVTNGGNLAFLGAASGGASSGTITITFSDGTTQTATLALSDWTLNGGSQQILPGEQIAAQMPYRNTPTGQEYVTTYVFFTAIALTSGKTTQSVTLPSSLTGGGMDVFAISGQPATSKAKKKPSPATRTVQTTQAIHAPQTSAPTNWATYLGSPGRTGYNGAETLLTPANAHSLTMKWKAHGAQGISDQPIIVGGLVYWGSWDGLMHATSATFGNDVWTTNLGQTSVPGCIPSTVGVGSTATYGQIGTTPVLFVGGGNDTMYALNATTGQIIWATTLEASTDFFIWDSPVVANGNLYIGVSSFGDCPNSVNTVFKLSATTGAIQNILTLAPANCPGDGVWGSPALDVATGVLYFATGNGCPTDPNASAIEAVSSGDLSLVDRWKVPAAQLGGDTDFGNTPTLFTAAINGVQRQMIGVASKNGLYYALDRTNLSAGPVWQDQIAVGGDCPDCGNGSISPSSFDGATLYVAGGNTTIGGSACKSSVRAVNPATGAYLWEHCISTGPTLGAVTTSPGLVAIASQTGVYVLSAATGATLFSYSDTSSGSFFFSAPTIANGSLYAPNDDGSFYAFGTLLIRQPGH
ncbi:MAG: PQQ-binding-like beta-propeller repeat protein [Ktedonobacterales bacterium]